MMKQWLLAAVSIFFSHLLTAQNISSTFDNDDDGWTAVNRVSNILFTTVNPYTLTYTATGGNPSGCISANETPSSLGTLYFVAPAKFRGNKTLAYGNKLSFDIKSQRDPTLVTFVEDDLVLEGGGFTLYFNLFVNNASNSINNWTHFDVPMNENAWLLGSRNGPNKPTKAQFQAVLCNITRFWIRSEYVTGADIGFLDNVVLEMSPRCYNLNDQKITRCTGQPPVIFNGKSYNTTGIYTDTIKNPCSLACDSIIKLDLKVVNALTKRIDTTLCNGQSIMVAGKKYSQSIFVDNTVKSVSGCDSIITLNLTVLPPLSITQNLTICQGDAVKVGTKKYTQTGNYTDVFKSISGCDSTVITNLTVILRVKNTQNATICAGEAFRVGNNNYTKTGIFSDTIQYSWGCDSLILTTNLTVNPVPTKNQKATICQGDAFQVGSNWHTQSGVFVDTLKSFTNCDSIVTTTLTVNPVSIKTQNSTICQGNTVKVGSKIYNKTGIFIDTLKNFLNCDSIITTILTVNPVSIVSQNYAICTGDFILVGTKKHSQTGVFRDTLKNITNCDSIVTTNLTVNPISIKAQNIMICQGLFITVGNKTYNRTGVFRDTLKNFTNCDSIITTTLIVSPPLTISQNLKICQGDFIEIGAKTYNQTGIYKDTLTTALGCDSLITTNLTVNPRYDRSQNVAICPTGSFSINNKIYTQAGTYQDTFRSIQGCDSVITTVLEVKTSATVSQNIALCNGQSLKVGAKNYTQTGIYRDTFKTVSGCDSIVISNLTINVPSSKTQTLKICQGETVNVGAKTYTQSGVFIDTLRNFTNCDSIITTNLTVIPPLSMSQNFTICQGDFIKIGIKTYNQTGIFKDTLKAISGCDSVVTTNLMVNSVFSKTQNLAICEGNFVKVGNKSYNQTGIFKDSLKTITGCDSIIITNLTVNKIARINQTLNICNGNFIQVGSKTYARTGIFTDTLKTVSGCDSIISTNLTVKAAIIVSQSLNICQGDFIKIGNKTYNQTGVFKDTLRAVSGCDSILTTHLKINIRYNRTQNVTICPSSSYTINFNTYTRAGTYQDTLFTIDHCDSIVTTHLSIQTIVSYTQNVAFCKGSSIKVGAKIYTQTGNYVDTIRMNSGCDSIVYTNLVVNVPTYSTVTAKICQGEFFKVGTKSYTQTGTYTEVIKNAANCDSIITIKLVVIPPLSMLQNLTICQGDFIKIGAKMHNTIGIFIDSLKSITGCDSVVTTNLKVNSSYSKTQKLNICEGSLVKVGTKTYKQTGIFVDSLKTITGCDSIIMTNLTVVSIFTSTQNLIICDGDFVKIGAKTYTQSGIFTDTLRSQMGCDSIVLTFLKVNPRTIRTQAITLCPSTFLKIGSHTYNQSGTYRDTLKSVWGCDSIITTILSVQPAVSRVQALSLCTGQSVKVGLKTYAQTGIYQDTLKTWTGCDSLITTHLSFNNIILKSQNLTICEGDAVKVGTRLYNKTGVFKDTLRALGGCDSVVTTNLTVATTGLHRLDTTLCGNNKLVIRGKMYSQTGIFNDSIKISGRCDSILQISLTVQPLAFTRNFITLCPSDTLNKNLRLAGVYKDTIASASGGCPQIVESIVQNSPLRVSAGSDIAIEIGDSVRLSPAIPTGANILWKWKADKALSCVDCPNPIVKPLETTTFTVEARDTVSNCQVKDDIRVVVKACASMFAPTSFSPNGDGFNDYFTLFTGVCVQKVKKMLIFNRWGALVFSKENFTPNNEQDGWDGTFLGKPLESAVYTYLIDMELSTGKTEKIWGDVTLMK
jgi:gliding motility-associated-like protein